LGTVFTKTLGVAIIGALVLAPLPPFSNPAPVERVENAKQAYNSSGYEPAPVVARYRAGEPVPVFTPAQLVEETSLEPAPVEAGIPFALATQATSTVDTVLPAAKVAKRTPSSKRAGVPATVIAAEQVALGLNTSEIVEVALDADANIVETVDTHGAKTAAEYNDLGDPVKITSPDGAVTYYSYDGDGNLTGIYNEKPQVVARFSWSDPIASIGTFFSSFGRALAGDDASSQTAIGYEEGNLTGATDASGEISFEYDEFGNLAAEENTGGDYTVYEYDELGNVIGKEVVVPAASETVSGISRFLAGIHLSGLAQYVARAYADEEELAQTVSLGYDERNNLDSFAVSLGDAIPAESTAIETPSIAAPAASSTPPIEVIAPIASSTETSLPTEAIAPAASSTEASSPTEPLIPEPAVVPSESVSAPEEVLQNVVSFLAAPVRAIIAWAGLRMARALADELIIEVAPESIAPSDPLSSIVIWNTIDALDNIVETENQKGEITKYEYNTRTDSPIGRSFFSSTGTKLAQVEYSLAANINRWVSRTENGSTESYEYDADGELIRVSGSASASYAYDDRGNRTESADANGTSRYTYDGNRLVSVEGGAGTRSYEYDTNGSVSAIRDSVKGTTSFKYTEKNAVSEIELPDGSRITYTYDAFNRRIGKTTPSGTELYQYEGKNPTRVTDESGTVLRQYIYDPKGNLMAIVKNSEVYSVLLDPHGSVIALTDSASNVVTRFSYDVWGRPNATDTNLTDFYYASGYYESTAGLYLLGPRTYDPSIGRFLQKDPLAGSLIDAISQNEYVYAGNDPINKVDPTGHSAEDVNVGQSPKAIAASARNSAQQMKPSIEAAEQEIAELEAVTEASEETLRRLETARLALESARGARAELLSIANDNEAHVARREAEVAEEAALDAAWIASQEAPPIVPTVTNEVMEPESASSTPQVPEPAVNEPSIVPEIAPVDPGPISYLSTLVSESIWEYLPKVEAKSKKSKKAKKKKAPPPPKKKKAEKKKAPPKKSKAELAKEAKAQKQAEAAKNLKKVQEAQRKQDEAAAALQKATAKKAPVPTPKVTALAQSTKQQVTSLKSAPAVPAAKQNPLDKLTSPGLNAKIAKAGLSLSSITSKELEKIAKGITAVKDKAAYQSVLANIRASELSAAGKAKIDPIVNSQPVKNAQYGLALCSFDPTIIGGSCGLLDGVLYSLQGNGISAGLSFGGAIPVVGFASDAAKSARLAENVAKSGSVVARVTSLRLTELRPTHYVDKSAKEMQKFVDDVRVNGVRESIKYIEEGGVKYIVDGHHRYFAALKVGLKEVPAERVSYPYAGYRSTLDLVLDGKMPGYWLFIK